MEIITNTLQKERNLSAASVAELQAIILNQDVQLQNLAQKVVWLEKQFKPCAF